MSTAASRRSKSTEALKRCIRSDIGSANRPDQAPEAGGGVGASAMGSGVGQVAAGKVETRGPGSRHDLRLPPGRRMSTIGFVARTSSDSGTNLA